MAQPTLSERERRLVELLAEGHTDATAAQVLGVSERTVSTSIRSLMDRFEVDNRFQLGLALGKAMPELVPKRAAMGRPLHAVAGD
jgi:DNA-binding NarL/FixJ family response regulator